MAEVKIGLQNMVTGASLQLGQTSTKNFILESVDWGEIQSERQTSAHPAQIGESVLTTTLGTRDILIKGWIVNETGAGLSALKRQVGAMVNPLQMIRLTYSSPLAEIGAVYLDFFPGTTVLFSKEKKENNDVLCYFEIEGKAYSPLFFKATETSVTLTTAQQQVQLLGDLQTGFRFSLVASGSVSNPFILNNYTGERLKFNYALSNGQKFEGSTVPGSRYVTRTYTQGGLTTSENAMRYFDLTSSWLMLSATNQAANMFKKGADSGVDSLTATMTFRPAWLEVQAIE